MLSNLCFRLFSYIRYYLRAENGMYIHSPFVFEWHQSLIEKIPFESLRIIENYRNQLSTSEESISLTKEKTGKVVKISSRYRNTSISPKFGSVLYKTSKYLSANSFIELGTSLGVSTLYLALSSERIKGTSIDYMATAIQFVSKKFEEIPIENVKLIEGSFEDKLPELISTDSLLDIVFIDGDHSFEATVFNTKSFIPKMSHNSVIILDDIRWSIEMYRAWETLRKLETFTYTIDYGRIGLLFITDTNAPQQHFILR